MKTLKEITIKTNNPYKILIGENLLQYSGEYVKKFTQAKKVLIITDNIVYDLYANIISISLKDAGFKVFYFIFNHGEQSKNLKNVEKIYSYLVENEFTRSDLIIALGGGVAGDIAGFAAATYMRGIDYIQIPTTLLSQIDSSIGGKTGVNLLQGKNLVGAFYQPRLVLIDINTLNTLSNEIISDGMAEAIKYALIKSSSLFYKIKNYSLNDIILELIIECINIKKEIVEKDENELGNRKLLNFGHTLGHAIEKFYNYSRYSHGQAVAIGIASIVRSCEKLSLTKKGTYCELISVLKKYNLPYSIDCNIDDLVSIAKTDKKASGQCLDIILIESIGTSYVKRISKVDFKKYIGG